MMGKSPTTILGEEQLLVCDESIDGEVELDQGEFEDIIFKGVPSVLH